VWRKIDDCYSDGERRNDDTVDDEDDYCYEDYYLYLSLSMMIVVLVDCLNC